MAAGNARVAALLVALLCAVAASAQTLPQENTGGGHRSCCCKKVQKETSYVFPFAEQYCGNAQPPAYRCVSCSGSTEKCARVFVEKTVRSSDNPGSCAPLIQLEPLPKTKVLDLFHDTYTYYGFTGWLNWAAAYPDCGGNNQSPVDISLPADAPCTRAQNVGDVLSWPASATFSVSQVNGNARFSCAQDSCGSATVNGKTFNFSSLHFHTPAEHTRSGVRYPLEVHCVHEADDGALLVVGRWFALTTKATAATDAVAKLFGANVFNAEDDKVKLQVALNRLVPKNAGYYTYSGSLTVPPCTDGLTWVFVDELSAGKIHDDANWARVLGTLGKFGGIARPSQNLNGRKIVKACKAVV